MFAFTDAPVAIAAALVCLLSGAIEPTFCYRINITAFETCRDHADAEVRLLAVQFVCDADRICGRLNGEYEIRVPHRNDDYELWLYVTNCAASNSNGDARCGGGDTAATPPFVQPMSCDRFHDDSSGPWHMISQAISHERCGAVSGRFALVDAQLRAEHLDGFVAPADAALPRYGMRMVFHKKGGGGGGGAALPSELSPAAVRACVDMEFELIF